METNPSTHTDLVPVRRALLSVSDKTGLIEFATALANEFKVTLISTGGTATYLRDAGLTVTDVSEVTGFPEMMDGRVKTLHPKIHGGLLALRDHKDHLASMWEYGIEPIDLLCVNLYPFAKTIEKPGVTFDEAIENIDIGGPAMIRSAAKNHAWVVVVTAPSRYEKILGDLRKHEGKTCLQHRRKQAQSAFAHTAEYDALIAKYLAKQVTPEVEPERLEQPTGGPAQHQHGHPGGQVAIGAAVEEPAGPIVPRDPDAMARAAVAVRKLAQSSNSRKAFFDILIRNVVSVVNGSEACAFLIHPDSQAELYAFVRTANSMFVSKESDAQSMAGLATEAFRTDRDTVVELGGKQFYPPGPPAFALTTLIRNEKKTDAVFVTITRCKDKDFAQALAKDARILADDYPLFAARNPMDKIWPEVSFPINLSLTLEKKQALRYGENPHQRAALYVDKQPAEASVAYATQHHGKELSYINLLDADGALSCVKEFTLPAACIVKHTTPCGCATAADLPTAFKNAYAGDPLAAFGGIVALNKPVDLATAEAITSIDKLLEVIVAPSYADDALQLLKTRWKNVRLLSVGPVDRFDPAENHLHKIVGGYLVQERDLLGLDETTWRIASTRKPTDAEMADLRFGWLVCKHVKSNAIVVAKNQMLLGAGAGQMDRPSAAKLAIEKAGARVAGSVAASDAFFPFPDGPKLLLDAGVTAIIHPGGSLKDQETIDLVNDRGAALVLTGQRHFKH
jgi:AICAR transformylase/IMP cyclohydrolase PurH